MNTPRTKQPRFFISYCIDDRKFVIDTCNMLAPYFGRENMYLFEDHPDLQRSFLVAFKEALTGADFVLFFVGERFGKYQTAEFLQTVGEGKAMLIVGIGGQRAGKPFPEEIVAHGGDRFVIYDHFSHLVPPATVRCAELVMTSLRDWWRANFSASWVDWDDNNLLYGLPRVPQLFDYEKTIIEFFTAQDLRVKGEFETESKPGLDKRRSSETILATWPTERIDEMVRDGAPPEWPKVYRYRPCHENHLDPTLAGDFRDSAPDGEGMVRAAALVNLDSSANQWTFPEAGPRSGLAFPRSESVGSLNVAILVAGGIAPGINAVIDSLVQRHHAYQSAAAKAGEGYELQIFGIKNGFLAIGGANAAVGPHLRELQPRDTIEFATRGGSMLGTSRDDELLQVGSRNERLGKVVDALSQDDRVIDILYVIGGDGSMKAGHALWHLANLRRPPERQLTVITVPKTMDNDILWVWQSFGFLSAVDESRRIVETLHTEVRSNPRLGIVQLFGSDSGFVVSHAVLASTAGHAILALIPEITFSAVGVARYLKKCLWENSSPRLQGLSPNSPIDPRFPHGLMVMAENAVPQDALECLGLVEPQGKFINEHPWLKEAYDQIAKQIPTTEREQEEIIAYCSRLKKGLRVEGQTSDTVRKLGLRIMTEAIPVFLRKRGLLAGVAHFGWPEPNWSKLRVVCSEPRHLVRALEPSTSDIITGQRLGLLAVDAAMAGYTDCMISQWLTEFALVPLDLVVLGRKRIPPAGMFWKSVISKTGQDHNLVAPYDSGLCGGQ